MGGVPLHDFQGPEPDRPQYHPRDPRWQTESSRQGPRGQVGGADVHLDLRGASITRGSGVTPPATPGPVAHRTMRTGPTPPASQRRSPCDSYATAAAPRGGAPPRNAQPPDPNLPIVGYAGHRKGERDFTDETVRSQVEAYNGSRPASMRGPAYGELAEWPLTPPAGGKQRPAIVGTRSPPAQSQQHFQQEMARAQQQSPQRTPPQSPKATYIFSPPTPAAARSSGGGGKQYLALAESQSHDYHAHQHGVKGMDRSTPRQVTAQNQPPLQRPGQRGAFAAASRQQQQQMQQQMQQASNRSTPRSSPDAPHWQPPSWDQLRSTPQEEVYRNSVGGVKLGYSGHIPDRTSNVGSSNYGNSLGGNTSQRDHGTRIVYEPAQPDHMISGKASSSAVGYAGHAPTNRDAVGTSYWQAAAGGAEPRFAGRSRDMRDLLSA